MPDVRRRLVLARLHALKGFTVTAGFAAALQLPLVLATGATAGARGCDASAFRLRLLTEATATQAVVLLHVSSPSASGCPVRGAVLFRVEQAGALARIRHNPLAAPGRLDADSTWRTSGGPTGAGPDATSLSRLRAWVRRSRSSTRASVNAPHRSPSPSQGSKRPRRSPGSGRCRPRSSGRLGRRPSSGTVGKEPIPNGR
jgi:hypothetical protein